MTLYEINSAILELIASCTDEDGNIIEEDAAQKLEELAQEKGEKIDNIACLFKEVTAEAKAVKEEKLRLAERQTVLENKAASLKKLLEYALNGEKFASSKNAISYRKTSTVDIWDINLIPDDLIIYSEPKADKTAVKNAIKSGRPVPGAELVYSNSMLIK